MSPRLRHIFLKLLALVPLLLTMAPAMAQDGNAVYAGQTTVLSVVETPGVTYTWYLYNDVEGLNLAQTEGNCPETEAYFVDGVNTGASVEVMWLASGTYFFKVVADDGCSNNLKLGKIEIDDDLPVAYFLEPEPICIGDPGELTLELVGYGPWEVTYTSTYTDLSGIEQTTTHTVTVPGTPYTFDVSPLTTTRYRVISVTDTNGVTNDTPSAEVELIVLPRPVTSPITRYTPE